MAYQCRLIMLRVLGLMDFFKISIARSTIAQPAVQYGSTANGASKRYFSIMSKTLRKKYLILTKGTIS